MPLLLVILAQPFGLLTLAQRTGNTVFDVTKFNLFQTVVIYTQSIVQLTLPLG